MLEFIDGAVWEQLFGNVKSPENPEMKEAWPGINMENLMLGPDTTVGFGRRGVVHHIAQ